MERRSLSKLPIWFKNLGESSRPLPYGSDVPARHCRACIAATARFVVACYIYGQPAVLWWLRRARAKRQAAANAALLSAVHAKKRRARRSVVVLSALLDALGVDSGVAGSKVKRVRRKYVRASDEWKGSTLFGYLYNQETDDAKEAIYKQKFRMTVKMFDSIASQLSASSCTFVPRHGFIKRKISKLKPVSFKLGACLYVLALGACIGSAADTASIGKSTLELWLRQFATACCTVLRPVYMPAKPLSPSLLQQVRSEFAARRGVPNVAMACDGSHVPFRTHHDHYRNYKGWYSILVVAFVNSFHLFVDGTVGYPGRAGDNTVLRSCYLLSQILEDPEAWLGPDGVILGDGGASDADGFFMNPHPHPKTPAEFYFNFCHSSTRFFVEEVFGRWKNRFRFLLHDHDMKHKLHTQLVYCTMILHNICTIHKDDAVDFNVGSDAGWQAFFAKYKRDACPSCTRADVAHCPHTARNRSYARRASAPTGKPSEQRTSVTESLWEALVQGEHDLMPAYADRSGGRKQTREYKQMQRAMHARAEAGRARVDGA